MKPSVYPLYGPMGVITGQIEKKDLFGRDLLIFFKNPESKKSLKMRLLNGFTSGALESIPVISTSIPCTCIIAYTPILVELKISGNVKLHLVNLDTGLP